MNKQHLSRRTILKGLGSVAIGLPLLEEMLRPTTAFALQGEAPVRAFNVFFGLGIPAPLQTEGFKDVLEPLQSLSKKLLIMRNVDHVRCDVRGINAHFDGATGSFTAMPAGGEAKAGGPSIDQVIRKAHYPKGLPAGMVPTLVGGTFFRRSRVGRYVHSYGENGTVAGTMQEKPRALFERVFGAVNLANDPVHAGQLDAMRAQLEAWIVDTDDKGQYPRSEAAWTEITERFPATWLRSPEFQ